MNFSKMRHRITFMKPLSNIQNSMSENVPKYEDIMTVWAFVSPRTGREYDEAQKLRAETTYNVSTRYFSDITPQMYVKFNDRILKIESVLDLGEKKEELLIVAVETMQRGD